MKLPRFVRSLSLRLLVLTMSVVILAEVLVFVPGLARERRGWLNRHLREAAIVALALSATPDGAAGAVDTVSRVRLLALAGSDMIRFREDGKVVVMLDPPTPITPEITVNVDGETVVQSLTRAVMELARSRPRKMFLRGSSSWEPSRQVELIVDEASLLHRLRLYAWSALGISLLLAATTGALIYSAVAALLVRPVRRITRSIAAFRADPERSAPLDDGRVGRAGGEIAIAGRELAAMQRELRAALWRNARLAALGTAMAKVSHDMRGILSSAMLSADRLSTHPDPKVKRSAETVLRAIERATELVKQMLAYTRDGPPPLEHAAVLLRPLIEEAAEGIPGLALRNEVAPGLMLDGDRIALLRVLGNLVRNAREAGARQVRISATPIDQSVSLEVTDDGPGLPEAVQASLFRPFTSGGLRGGSGLGLAIARDLTRAHGGDIELVGTGPEGTTFRLRLPAPKPGPAEIRQAS